MGRPISQRILIHSATLKKPAGLDRDRNQVYTSTVLSRIRIAITKQTILTDVGAVKSDAMTLIFDAVNSTPVNTVISEDDVITFSGRDYTVKSVTPCYAKDSDAVHHWECSLV